MYNNIKIFIEEMISKKYFIVMIIEDLIRYFNFNVISDQIKNDIRTLQMKNKYGISITINSKIISNICEKFSQYNLINLKSNTDELSWEYVGNCYRTNKNNKLFF